MAGQLEVGLGLLLNVVVRFADLDERNGCADGSCGQQRDDHRDQGGHDRAAPPPQTSPAPQPRPAIFDRLIAQKVPQITGQVPSLLTGETLHATTIGWPDQAAAEASLARLALSEGMPLWILDEPFAALDAAAVEHVQNLIAEHLSRGAAVILTTHLDAKIAAAAALRIDLETS